MVSGEPAESKKQTRRFPAKRQVIDAGEATALPLGSGEIASWQCR
jgi:hypothetical protein